MFLEDFKKHCRDEPRENPTNPRKALDTQEEKNIAEIIRKYERYDDDYFDDGGFIYIMTDSTDDNLSNDSKGRFKVGSTNNPERMLTQAKTFNIDIQKIKEWRVETKRLTIEHNIHGRLRDAGRHIEGEWFRGPFEELNNFIGKCIAFVNDHNK